MLRFLHPIMYDVNIGAPDQPKCVDIIIPLRDMPTEQDFRSEKKRPWWKGQSPNIKFYNDIQASAKQYGKPYRLWCWDPQANELKLIQSNPAALATQLNSKKDPLCIVCMAKRALNLGRFSSDGRFPSLFHQSGINKNKEISWSQLVHQGRVTVNRSDDDIKISNSATFFVFYDTANPRKKTLAIEGRKDFEDIKSLGFTIGVISPDMVRSELKKPMPPALESEAELRKHLKEGFQSYIKLIKEEYNEKFDHGFKIFKKSRATNRKINYLLAQDLLKQLDDSDKTIDSIFKDIKQIRKDIIDDDSSLSDKKKQKFKKDTIHSQKLNGVINLYKKYVKQKTTNEKKLQSKLKNK